MSRITPRTKITVTRTQPSCFITVLKDGHVTFLSSEKTSFILPHILLNMLGFLFLFVFFAGCCLLLATAVFRPDDLLQFASHFAEPLAAILFLLFCHCYTTFPNLLGFGMNGVLFAERTVFVYLDSVGIVFLILILVVISLLAFGARQSYSRSVSFCHSFHFPKN